MGLVGGFACVGARPSLRGPRKDWGNQQERCWAMISPNLPNISCRLSSRDWRHFILWTILGRRRSSSRGWRGVQGGCDQQVMLEIYVLRLIDGVDFWWNTFWVWYKFLTFLLCRLPRVEPGIQVIVGKCYWKVWLAWTKGWERLDKEFRRIIC